MIVLTTYLTTSISYFSFFYIFFNKCMRKNIYKRDISVIVAVAILCIDAFCDIHLQSTLGPFPLYICVVLGMLYGLFQVSVIEIIPLGIGQWLILSNIENVFRILLQKLEINDQLRFCITDIVISMLLWFLYWILKRKNYLYYLQLPSKAWWLLDAVMFILTFVMEFFGYIVAMETINVRMCIFGRKIVVVAEFMILLLLYLIIFYFNKMNHYRMQQEIMEKYNEQQQKYYLELLEREKKTKIFRHDMVNDLLELDHYCKRGKYEQLEQYLDGMLQDINLISQNYYDLGNDVINTIVNCYLSPLKERYAISVKGLAKENLGIAQRDLCIIVGNLVKNAVDAVRTQDTGYINFEVETGKDNLAIVVQNSFVGNIMYDKEGNVISTKEDNGNHGYGLKSVYIAVQKYKGLYCATGEDGEYKVEIYLPITVDGEI